MYHQALIAGFGGQGVLTCGQVLARAAAADGKYATWMPSYGPEQRGGTAACAVTISDRPIGSPLAEDVSAALIFNEPSLVKFGPQLRTGSLLVLNSSRVQAPSEGTGLDVYQVQADQIARDVGLPRAANMVMLGSYLAISRVVSIEAVQDALVNYFGIAKQHLVEVNRIALTAGRTLLDRLRAPTE